MFPPCIHPKKSWVGLLIISFNFSPESSPSRSLKEKSYRNQNHETKETSKQKILSKFIIVFQTFQKTGLKPWKGKC